MFEHFFIVGAQRSGTSYLYQLLAEHPEIEMAKPLRPEPKFILNNALFDRGLEYYEDHFFGGKGRAWLRGEKSTSYIESEKAAYRLARCFPTSKILFVLRDPVERAISNYWFSVNNGWETLPISEAFLREEKRRLEFDRKSVSASPYAYLKRGRYIEYISMYERYFPGESIKVLLFERLIGSLDLVRDLYVFLGAASDFIPLALHKIVNKGDRPDIPLRPELERYLIDYFAEFNTLLSEHLGLDLAEWQRT